MIASLGLILGFGRRLWRPPAGAFESRPLNIVLVTADTLRADKLGAYGSEAVPTPHLDALADSGVVFENARTVAPITLPAHASMFTGTYPLYHGVRDNGGRALDAEHATLAESLASHGYATGAFVGAFVLDARWGLDQGFERYFDDFDGPIGQADSVAESSREGGDVLAPALEWMDSVVDRPFMSWLHFYDPHRPYDPPEPFRSQTPGEMNADYEGEVAYVDSLVGELMTWLEEKGLRQSTVVAFLSDHGEGLGEHGELTHGFFVYDSTMRVPFILSLPDATSRGVRVRAQVRTIDLMPTLLELVGIEAPEAVQGVSLVPRLFGDTSEDRLTAYGESVFPAHYGWSELASLRTDAYHYIEAPRPELYDVIDDPGEVTNLAESRASTVRELQQELASMRQAYASPEAAFSGRGADRETRERLTALGYVGTSSARRVSSGADPKDKIELFQRIRESAQWIQDGRAEEAQVALEEILEEDSGVAEVHQLLGQLHGERGDHSRAAKAFEAALLLDGDYRPALFEIGMSYQSLGRSEEAAAAYERLLAVDPAASQARFAWARIRIDQGRFQEVVDQLSPQLLAAGRERAAAHQLRGEAWLGLEELDHAERESGLALELDATLASAHNVKGMIYERRGRPQDAEASYRRALSVAPGHLVHFNLAKLLALSGRQDEMLVHLKQAVALNPDFAVGQLYLANALLELGDIEAAQRHALKGLELGPEPAFAPLGHFILADIYERLGRGEDSARELAKAQELQRGIQ